MTGEIYFPLQYNAASAFLAIPTFAFNAYSSLLLPAAIQCFIFSALVFWRYSRDRILSDFIFGMILLTTGLKISFWMLGFAGWYDSHDGHTSFMFYFPFSACLLAGPLLYFYFKSLTNATFQLTRKDWPHLILPGLYMLLVLGKVAADYAFYYPFPKLPEFQYGTRGPFAELDKSQPISFLAFGAFIFYLILILGQFPIYRAYLRNNFSATAYLDFDWLRNMLLTVSAGVFIFSCFAVWDFITGSSSYKTDWFAYLILSVLSYYFTINGYYVEKRPLCAVQFTIQPAPLQVVSTELPDAGEWMVKVDQLMLTARPYLQPDLSLADLAGLLKTNRTVVSKLVNQHYDLNFNDFINSYRIKEVIARLKEGRHLQLSLLGIAYDCGFNAKATFNRSFKKATGLTPKAYIEILNQLQP